MDAWASQKSFRRKAGSDDGNGANFRGQKRSNETHQSTTDPESRLYRKSYGKELNLAYLRHALGRTVMVFTSDTETERLVTD